MEKVNSLVNFVYGESEGDIRISVMRQIDKSQIKNFEELLTLKYGAEGAENRERFESNAKLYFISEMLKEARKEAKLTQEELAVKIGTKKSYISRIENGKCDIQLSTLYKIFEYGLGKKISLSIL